MKSFLFVAWFTVCFAKSCLSFQSPIESYHEPIEEREPVFRKDYVLDNQQRGWYKLHRIPEKWHDARLRCELEGAELASPLDAQIHQMLHEMLRPIYSDSVFTGIHSLFSYGDYYSLKGVSVEDMPVTWSRDVSSDEDKRCVAMLRDDTINNVKCSSELPFICYKRNDYTPLTECGTVDTEYRLNEQLNTCYKMHEEGKPWEDAFKTCSAEGGALAVINSDEEFAAVIQLFNNTVEQLLAEQGLQYKVFVGILDWNRSGQWVTIHDEHLEKSGFSKWSPNYYNNQNFCGGLDCLGLVKLFCTEEAYFICEKKPDSLITRKTYTNN